MAYKIKGSEPITADAYLQSGDIEDRIEYLESERDTALEQYTEEEEERTKADGYVQDIDALLEANLVWIGQDGTHYAVVGDWDEETETEYKQLKDVENELPRGNEQMIADGSFEEHARQLAEDTGDVSKTDQWPYNCIDWELAANELKQDYTTIELMGETYHFRD